MTKRLTGLASIVLLSLGAMGPQGVQAADEYLEASRAACNHIRDCAMGKMSEIPPEYRPMMEQSLATMCQSLPSAESIPGFGPAHKMYAPALACMKSIPTQSCKSYLDDGLMTPECKKLENM